MHPGQIAVATGAPKTPEGMCAKLESWIHFCGTHGPPRKMRVWVSA